MIEKKNGNANDKDSLVLSMVNESRDAFNSHDPKAFGSIG